MKFFTLLSLFFSLTASSLQALCYCKDYKAESFLGPEIYYLKREKEGGTRQDGVLYGVRGSIDRIERYKFYWGADFLWAQGTLKGKSGEASLCSTFTDANIEARLGYTFQAKCWRCLSFTPYVGGGFFWETNDYRSPSPLPLCFKNRFSYVPIGFLSQVFLTPTFSAGVNLKVRYLIDSEVAVSHDPYHDNMKQHYTQEVQYRVECPLVYFPCLERCPSLAVGLSPFYEYRPYGYLPNFPFDFLKTELRLYGATLKVTYLF